jgi:uncharacterized protein YceK
MKLSAVAAVAALGVAMSGCATVIEGTTQSVSVETTPAPGAQCALTNSQGTWFVSTPGSVTVHKTKTDLDVTCKKDGYQPGHVVATAHFAKTTAGNVIAGGVVGIGVDAISGANFYYDSPISVPLGEKLASGETPSPFPIIVHCSSPAVSGALASNGPEGYVTATVRFDINADDDANAVQVAPAKDGVCTVAGPEGTEIRSATFDIDSAASWTAGNRPPRDIEKHIEVLETAPDRHHTAGQSYTFTVRAKDTAQGKVTLNFPVSYR